MLNCKEISKLVSQSQDRDLRLGEKMQLKMHVLMCRNCKNLEKNILSLRSAMQNFSKNKAEK